MVVRNPEVQTDSPATVKSKKRERGGRFARIGSHHERKSLKEEKPKEVSQSTWLIPKDLGEIFATTKTLRKAKRTYRFAEQL
jgi:hypothetical protein